MLRALNNTKTPTSDALFCVIFVPIFPSFSSFFIQKSFTSWHHQTNKDRTLLRRFQSTSWYFLECVCYHPLVVCFCFLFLGALSLSFFFFFFFLTLFVFKSLLSRRSFFLFVLIFPEMIKELPPKKKKKKKGSRGKV